MSVCSPFVFIACFFLKVVLTSLLGLLVHKPHKKTEELAYLLFSLWAIGAFAYYTLTAQGPFFERLVQLSAQAIIFILKLGDVVLFEHIMAHCYSRNSPDTQYRSRKSVLPQQR